MACDPLGDGDGGFRACVMVAIVDEEQGDEEGDEEEGRDYEAGQEGVGCGGDGGDGSGSFGHYDDCVTAKIWTFSWNTVIRGDWSRL